MTRTRVFALSICTLLAGALGLAVGGWIVREALSSPGINADNFGRIRVGNPLSRVKTLLGRDPDLIGHQWDRVMKRQWDNRTVDVPADGLLAQWRDPGVTIIVTFDASSTVYDAQFQGSEPGLTYAELRSGERVPDAQFPFGILRRLLGF